MDDMVAVGMEAWFDTSLAAATVTYKGASIPAHFSREEIVGSEGRGEQGVLEVRAVDVPAPAYRDTVIINGVTWYEKRIISGDGYSFRLELYRDENPLRR